MAGILLISSRYRDAVIWAAFRVEFRGSGSRGRPSVIEEEGRAWPYGANYSDQADTDPLHDENIDKQLQLNDKGRADAKQVGDVFKAAGIPIGKSYSSRFYRVVETARLIGGNNGRAKAFRAIVVALPEPGTNTLVVTQHP
ncbi:MAG: hypothetical protein C5B48_07335 [Candidatus Rokuibacteriota bacterium]|nr:MAG: hypothetical protein C5B48_07335 [Candidatus Rokubacteria bacterium]